MRHPRFLALLLAGALCLAPLSAQAAETVFPAVNAYTGFADVPAGAWYAKGVQTAFEIGLMRGTGAGFTPGGNITVAECAAIACRVSTTMRGVDEVAQEGTPWYQNYVNYLNDMGVRVDNFTSPATRSEFFRLLSAVVPKSELSPINSIQTLPDTSDTGVLAFYNAGILTGTDEYGTFSPGATITRAECAVMLSRIARPEERVRFTPKPAGGDVDYSEALARTMALKVNGKEITVGEFVGYLNLVLDDWSAYLAQRGVKLDWSVFGTESWVSQYKTDAQRQAVRYQLAATQATALGCTIQDLPARLAGNPNRETLSAYAQSADFLCASHILVDDERTAQIILDGLAANPTLAQFNALLTVYGTDPGMRSRPNGYLFGAGDMVEEFESATRALSVGSYTKSPVKSQFGYHIIWRLDPVSHPDLLPDYQNRLFEQSLLQWEGEATVTVNEKALELLTPDIIWASYQSHLSGK